MVSIQAMPLFLLGVAAWLCGLGAYALVWIVAEGPPRPREFASVAVWSSLPFAVYLAVCAAAIKPLRRWSGTKMRLARALCCFGLGLLPILLFNIMWGQAGVNLFIPENAMFAVLFCVAGAVFGAAYPDQPGKA